MSKPKINVVGRPLKWKTRKELIALINKYLNDTPEEEYTVTGLAIALRSSRQLLDDYQKRDKFADIITEAKLIVENAYEKDLRRNGGSGNIFALKNFGWSDKTEVDQNIGNKDDKPFEVNVTVTE